MTRHSTILMGAKTPDAYPLHFVEQSIQMCQTRFQGRLVLVPEIDLGAYTCRAVIDWVAISFLTKQPTQPRWINEYARRAAGLNPHVKLLKIDEDSKHRSFLVKFQEPRLDQLRKAVAAIDSSLKLEEPPGIAGIEISVDFRPKSPSRELMARMLGVLARCHLPGRDVIANASDRPRYTWGSGSGATKHVLGWRQTDALRDEPLLRCDEDEAAAFDACLYAGAKGSRSAWRTMVKLVDAQNLGKGTRRELPENEQRVRIEVTLNQEELEDLGLRSIEDLMAFSFQKLQARYFRFFLPTIRDSRIFEPGPRHMIETIEADRLRKFLNAGVLGLQAKDQAWERLKQHTRREGSKRSDFSPPPPPARVGRGSSTRLLAYKKLDSQVANALRHLGDWVRRST